MSDTTLDLWPENFGVIEVKPPVAILKEQAALLGKKTSGIVEARIKTTIQSNSVHGTPTSKTMVHTFDLHAPALGYNFELFTVQHGINELYPVSVITDYMGEDDVCCNCRDESDFIDALRQVFANEKTKMYIANLIAHSTT